MRTTPARPSARTSPVTSAFHDVPYEHVYLRFHGQDVAARPYWFQSDSPIDNLRIELARQGRFQLTLAAGAPEARPDSFEVWNVHGQPIAVKTSGGYPPPGRTPLPEGQLPAYRTTDDARWLVLYRDGREIERQELRIRPGSTIAVEL